MKTITIHIPIELQKAFVALAKKFSHPHRSKGQLSRAILASFFCIWGNEEQKALAQKEINAIKERLGKA